MFKKFLKALPRVAAIACALFTGVSFAACKQDSGESHTHSFSTTLTQGETEHWYECECGAKQGVIGHSYENGVCRCGKTDPDYHVHDFTGEWVKGETEHWHKCKTCEETRDRAAHTYTNGVCKCGKADPDYHVHDFTGEWVKGETEHWHKCKTCNATQDNEAHVYTNGVCKCGKADPNPAPETDYSFPESVNFGNDVYVHDPSIFKDPNSNLYYAFGSHFAVASSSDLIHWTQVVGDGSNEESGQREAQKLYGNGVNWRTVLTKAVAHAGTSAPSTWAPDVEFYNGKYYMYVSLSSFGSNQSAIVRVESDNVTGPYANEVMIVKSTRGTDIVNCIDPELFYDKENKLWMVYGSFSDGIYIKELYNEGANWGIPKEDGFGTKLWQGFAPADAAQGGPEGPFIFRNGDYYYLMVSDGSLSSNYNMRVARSTSPDGPYYDITGADMAAAHGKGNKLAGNWKFDGETGKAAFGHNSVCEIDGEFFVVAHMRYEEYGNVSGGHNLRVHRLLFNGEGWPVLASERYAGETLGKIEESEIAGSYDLILHTTGKETTFVNTSRYTLGADHSVTGALNGTWSYQEDGNYIEITLGGVTYKGTAMPVWTDKGGVISLSAVSASGGSLWANGTVKAKDPNLSIIQQTEGSANNTAVAAFNPDDGFTVSFRASGANSDWNAHALVCRGLEISLPNLRILADNTAGLGTTQVDIFPNGGGSNVGSGTWNCYLNKASYVTITISKTDGVKFYQNGACTQSYAMTNSSVSAFVNAFLEGVKAEGFTFAESGFTASDLIVSRGAADAVKAREIYNYYG